MPGHVCKAGNRTPRIIIIIIVLYLVHKISVVYLLATLAGIAAGVGIVFSRVCLSVCLSTL